MLYIVINQSVMAYFFLKVSCFFDIEEGNDLCDSLDLARTFFLDRKSLAWYLHDPNI